MIQTRKRTDQEEFWKFTDEEMETAKNTDLPDLLEHLGYHVKRAGSYYTTREMDSLMIKNRRTWKRYSSGKGGDAITFLQEFEGKGFREAVDYLLEFNGQARDAPRPPRPPPKEEERPEFVLPPANGNNRRVFAYLRKRGIAAQVIRAFLRLTSRERITATSFSRFGTCPVLAASSHSTRTWWGRRPPCTLSALSHRRLNIWENARATMKL